jgi:hypothetical protein
MDAVKHITWICSECGEEFDTRAEAEDCCTEEKNDDTEFDDESDEDETDEESED